MPSRSNVKDDVPGAGVNPEQCQAAQDSHQRRECFRDRANQIGLPWEPDLEIPEDLLVFWQYKDCEHRYRAADEHNGHEKIDALERAAKYISADVLALLVDQARERWHQRIRPRGGRYQPDWPSGHLRNSGLQSVGKSVALLDCKCEFFQSLSNRFPLSKTGGSKHLRDWHPQPHGLLDIFEDDNCASATICLDRT